MVSWHHTGASKLRNVMIIKVVVHCWSKPWSRLGAAQPRPRKGTKACFSLVTLLLLGDSMGVDLKLWAGLHHEKYQMLVQSGSELLSVDFELVSKDEMIVVTAVNHIYRSCMSSFLLRQWSNSNICLQFTGPGLNPSTSYGMKLPTSGTKRRELMNMSIINHPLGAIINHPKPSETNISHG